MAASHSTFQLHTLLEKMSNPDSDFRFMSLNDLLESLNSPSYSFTSVDPSLMSKIIDAIVKALSDQNGEVQNLAVKCLGPLITKVKENQIAPLIDRLSQLSMTSEDPSIPSTALRTIVTNLPRPPSNASTTASTTAALQASQPGASTTVPPRPEYSPQAVTASQHAIQKTLLPKLQQLLQPPEPGKHGGATLDSVDLLIETIKCFGVILTGAEVERLQIVVMALLESDRTSGVVKKRAVTALSLLCVYAPDELLSSFISHLIESFRAQGPYGNVQRVRLLVSVSGALARGIPDRFGPYLKQLCPFVLAQVDGKDIQDRDPGDEPDMDKDEVREAALVALESFQSCCTSEMKKFTDDLLDAGCAYLKYDPNYADPGEDDDEEMGGTQETGDEDYEDDEFGGGSDDEDAFEDDGNFSDEDDISWKVRRCAAKLLSTIVATRAPDLILGKSEGGGRAYTLVAPLLIERFREREENVRLEVLAAATALVNNTGEVAKGGAGLSLQTTEVPASQPMAPPSPFKTRRGSDASMLDTFAVPQLQDSADDRRVRENLLVLVPRIAKSIGKLLNNKATTLPTKQASITLLSACVSVLHGGFDQSLSIFIEALVNIAKGESLSSAGSVVAATAQGGSAATATASSVRIEVLRLLAKIFENHALSDVSQYLEAVVPALTAAVNDTGYKISFEALGAVIALARLLTWDGAATGQEHLRPLFEVVLLKVQSTDVDLEVREKAILTLGIILSRTSSENGVIDQKARFKALGVLLERLKNETTRVTSARAIEGVAKNTTSPQDVEAGWIQAVVNECGGQLRKSNRALRAASLDALRNISANDSCRAALPTASKQGMVNILTPLLVVGDMQLLAVAIAVLKFMIMDPKENVGVTDEVVTGVCNLVKSNLGSGVVLENLLSLVDAIGKADPKGKLALMQALLQRVGVTGETSIVAKVVAQLLVSGGADAGGFNVGVRDFVEEVRGVRDEKRKSLALMVLGEIGYRMGSKFTIQPNTFLGQFEEASDNVPIAAAVALGLAGAGNVDAYVPFIMSRLTAGQDGYLLVHSLKEIIQHSSADGIKNYSSDIWNALLTTATKNDDAKAIASECVGRLTILDPYTFLPELQKHLSSPQAAVRGMTISALRYTFTDTESSYDELLRPIVVDFLESMLQDQELENRRLALTALNSATSNKPHLLAGEGLQRLLPRVYEESVVKPELVREVQMGPFRHRVDDGLEVRKSAYETLYALLETPFWNVSLESYFERTIAGLGDEHDIRALANLTLAKLAVIAKSETFKRLDVIADSMKRMLSEKPKENAVKQEIERHREGVRGVIKTAVLLNKEVRAGVSVTQGGLQTQLREWKAFWDWLVVGFAAEVKAVEEGKSDA